MAGNIAAIKKAKLNRNDEFYTQMKDIEVELSYYKEALRGKVIYCPCDDPSFSNFFKYFYNNFDELGIKELICSWLQADTCSAEYIRYSGGSLVTDTLIGDGDFRSMDCQFLLDECDIVITNPPFSLFSDFVELLNRYEKDFLIIGSNLGACYNCCLCRVIDGSVEVNYPGTRKSADMDFITPSGDLRDVAACWFTTLVGYKKRFSIELLKVFNTNKYEFSDDGEYLLVPDILSILAGYWGSLAVPCTLLIGHDLSSFDIIKLDRHVIKNGKNLFNRLIIRRRLDDLF